MSNNQPLHYTENEMYSIEYIKETLTADALEGYYVGNIIKYIYRYKFKNGLEDLQKCEMYLNLLIELYDIG